MGMIVVDLTFEEACSLLSNTYGDMIMDLIPSDTLPYLKSSMQKLQDALNLHRSLKVPNEPT